jgi:cell division transport system permease protein
MDIMRLVGATDGYIKIPYYLQGMMQGGLGAGIGLGLLYAAFHVLVTRYAPTMTGGLFTFNFLAPRLSAALIGGGIVVGWLGCFASLKQFMKG